MTTATCHLGEERDLRGAAFKVVGPGKDISIPVDRVESATFVHNGGAGSVKADAYLVKESTLDVISDSTVLMTPVAIESGPPRADPSVTQSARHA